MHIAKQIAIFLGNQPGMLARVCDTLQRANINIHAISTGDTVDHIVVRLVVSDTARALRVFEEHGSLAVTSDVLLIECDNKPGCLTRIAQKLADANINIEYCYSAALPGARKSLVVLRASDTKKALKVLNS